MIVLIRSGNVFETSHRHIAFAANTEGLNNTGFSRMVSTLYWPELAETGEKKLGDVLTKTVKGKTFYALVCHSLGVNGWKKTPETITACLDSINVPEDETIAITLIGAGMIGKLAGADTFLNLGGMARSNKKVAVYTL